MPFGSFFFAVLFISLLPLLCDRGPCDGELGRSRLPLPFSVFLVYVKFETASLSFGTLSSHVLVSSVFRRTGVPHTILSFLAPKCGSIVTWSRYLLAKLFKRVLLVLYLDCNVVFSGSEHLSCVVDILSSMSSLQTTLFDKRTSSHVASHPCTSYPLRVMLMSSENSRRDSLVPRTTKGFVDHVSFLSSPIFCSSGLTFFLKFVFIKIFFKAVAILASSVSKLGVERSQVVNDLSCFNFSNPRHCIRGTTRSQNKLLFKNSTAKS